MVALQPCPHCQSDCDLSLGTFCENCGYNFSLGGSPPVSPWPDGAAGTERGAEALRGPAEAAAEPEAAKAAGAIAWSLEIAIDPTLRDPQFSPEPPQELAQEYAQQYAQQAAQRLPLQKAQTILGRTQPRKAIYPDLSLDFDDAISSRHLLLTVQPDGTLLLRDLGSSNGTFLRGQPLLPMEDHLLQPGDSFTLGHWTRITVHSP